MSELNDRSEDLERQMLSLEQRVEQLTAGFSALPAHLSATLSAQHAALVHLLRERDTRDSSSSRGGSGGAVIPLSPAPSLTTASASVSPVQVTTPAATQAQVPTLALDSPLSPSPLSPEASLESSPNPNTCTSSCWKQLWGSQEDKYGKEAGREKGVVLVLSLQSKRRGTRREEERNMRWSSERTHHEVMTREKKYEKKFWE